MTAHIIILGLLFLLDIMIARFVVKLFLKMLDYYSKLNGKK